MKTRLAASALLVLALVSCGKGKAPAAAKPAAPAALPEEVRALAKELAPTPAPSPGAARASVLEATGELVPPVRSELTSRLIGRVARVLVDEGARVSAGQPMLELETDYLKLEAERAEAESARASAALGDAERDWTRKKGLLEKGSVSPAAADRSESAWLQARASKASAEAVAGLARQRLSDAVLRAPIDGVVLERRSDVGEKLAEGTVTFVVVQTAPLKLRFRVPERYVGEVAPGASVSAEVDPYPGETFSGKVSVVVPAVDPQSRTFIVEALFDNRDGRLRPGLFARVRLDLSARRKA